MKIRCDCVAAWSLLMCVGLCPATASAEALPAEAREDRAEDAAGSLYDEDEPAGRWRIEVERWNAVVVRMPSLLQSACGTKSAVYGCTQFERTRLTPICRKDRGAWVIDSRAVLKPQMYLSDAAYLVHENEHVVDIRARLGPHLARLSAQRFAFEDDCLRASGAAIVAFKPLLARLSSESNARLDPGAPRDLVLARSR